MNTLGAVFVKRDPAAPPGFFESEAAGLAWLAASGAVRVPAVLGADDDSITIARIPAGAPSAKGAEELGTGLSDLHAAGADDFGAKWPGFIGPLPMDNTPPMPAGPSGTGAAWAAFYAEKRVLPFVRDAVDRGALDPAGAHVIEGAMSRLTELCGESASEPPSRIHGDLWAGNVVWDVGGRAWLVDPAAHGGHRETDLAMLALFGAPHLDRILAAYEEKRPLAPGWRERVGLHQLHPLLVHAVLFGGSYGARAVRAARA